MQFMHIELQRKTQHFEAMVALLNCLRCQPDNEAAELLARLRLGESIETLVEMYLPNEQSPGAVVAATTPFSQSQYGFTYFFSNFSY